MYKTAYYLQNNNIHHILFAMAKSDKASVLQLFIMHWNLGFIIHELQKIKGWNDEGVFEFLNFDLLGIGEQRYVYAISIHQITRVNLYWKRFCICISVIRFARSLSLSLVGDDERIRDL